MQMDEVTQQNAALVEEAAAAARAMQEQADELEHQIRYFRVQEKTKGKVAVGKRSQLVAGEAIAA